MFSSKNFGRAGKGLLAGILAVGVFSFGGLAAAEEEDNVPMQEIKQSIEKMGQTVFPIGNDNAAYEKY